MILEAGNISKSFGALEVLKNLDLECHKGKIYGLIGVNGAGKTTLFCILLGLIKQDKGTVDIYSQSIKPIGGIVEKPALYEYLSAYGNLKVFARIQGLKLTQELYFQCMQQVGLSPGRKDAVRNYSMGMEQGLGRLQYNDILLSGQFNVCSNFKGCYEDLHRYFKSVII
ncbi:ATP-binding cassette domain-containing protein [uncultured Eudoraea sp.]|uniref:ATP-binding cassette domain-containing protein n=1 Tax=uncultured Eudoraea sp. TaxID=1035614 RepID=UPI00262EB175|nr:ATP-binding cassette domain-containing protein [uncultured Eudoraea sp.]